MALQYNIPDHFLSSFNIYRECSFTGIVLPATFTKHSGSESFGLIPEYVHLRKTKSGSPVKVPFSPSNLRISSEQPTADDHEKVLQTLYILDRFAVSDESYHELGTLSGTLPPLYKVKKARNIINESLEIESPYLGAFRPFYNPLLKELTKAVSYKLMSSSLASVWYIHAE